MGKPVGGYYFPTKREPLLHGLCPAALLRFCQSFHAEFDCLAEADPRRYLEAGIAVAVHNRRQTVLLLVEREGA